MSKQSKMIKTFQDIVKRVPNSVLQKAFSANGLIAGQKADRTLEKTISLIDANKKEDIDSLNKIIKWYFQDYLLHGEKAVFFYEINEEESIELIKYFKKFTVEDSVFIDNYPLCVPDSLLSKYIEESALVETRGYDSGVALIFSSVRKYTNQSELPKKFLTAEALAKYSDASKIFAIENRYRQFFDVVTIFPSGMVEIRIDNPKLDLSKQMPVKERANAFISIVHILEEYVSVALGRRWALPEPYNLLDTVDNIFTKRKEGNVRLINFTTSNSNAKQSKATHRDLNDCCRDDAFVKAGIKEVKTISPYRIHVNWERDGKYFVDLYILGTIYNLDKSKSPLNEAIISRVRSKTDYDFIRNKVLKHFNDEKKTE